MGGGRKGWEGGRKGWEGGREGESPLPQAELPRPSGPVGFGPPGWHAPGPKVSNAEQVGTRAAASPWIPAAPASGLSPGAEEPWLELKSC